MNAEKPVILIVDDDPTGRLMMRAALEPAGFEILECADGAAAVSAFAEQRPDLVVLDVVMPGMDGFEACAQMRATSPGRQTPILMLTGLEDIDSINRAYEVGATDFATKPVNLALLGHRVRYLLRAHRTLLQLGESESWLAQAQRLAHLGHWEWDSGLGTYRLSPEVGRILGLAEGHEPDPLVLSGSARSRGPEPPPALSRGAGATGRALRPRGPAHPGGRGETRGARPGRGRRRRRRSGDAAEGHDPGPDRAAAGGGARPLPLRSRRPHRPAESDRLRRMARAHPRRGRRAGRERGRALHRPRQLPARERDDGSRLG